MAKNYTYTVFVDSAGRDFSVLKTKASNIKLVNLFKQYGAPKYISDTSYYGMNASFFDVTGSTANKLLNIAYQDGECIGSDRDTDPNDGYRNACGYGLIYWTGTQLKYQEMVLFGSSSVIPTVVGSWAQGGYNLYLCDSDWEEKYASQSAAPELGVASPRTGVLINTSTGYVHLFACRVESTTVSDLRKAMMEYAGIAESSSSGSWRAIMTDGGQSMQMRCASATVTPPLGGRPVPEIFALVNKT